mgnify:CR=1 FL=1
MYGMTLYIQLTLDTCSLLRSVECSEGSIKSRLCGSTVISSQHAMRLWSQYDLRQQAVRIPAMVVWLLLRTMYETCGADECYDCLVSRMCNNSYEYHDRYQHYCNGFSATPLNFFLSLNLNWFLIMLTVKMEMHYPCLFVFLYLPASAVGLYHWTKVMCIS